MTSTGRVPLDRADKVRRLLMTLGVLACIGLIVLAVTRTPRGDEDDLVLSGEIVEQLIPARESEVLRQQQIGIDLGPRYDGRLVVNGISIPDDELLRRPELNQVFFQPGEGTSVPELSPGRNCVTAIVWPVVEGPASGQPIEWCFEVT